MATISSNRPAVTAALFGLSQAMNLRGAIPGRKRRLGDELMETVAVAIEERTVRRQVGPDGNPLPRLKARTIARKRSLGLDTRILIETHEMLDPAEVLGTTSIDGKTATMTAGTTDDVRFKVEQAEEGAANRPVRHFYEPGPDGEAAVDTLVDEVLNAAVSTAEGA